MTVFPTGYADKGSADAGDKVWASDGVTNFNITVSEIGDKNFTDKSTSDLSEGTNLYYTETRVTNNTAVVSKADKTNVLELDNTTSFTPTADFEPATKKYVDDVSIPSASETVEGIVERATDAEAALGTDTTRYISSKHLKDSTFNINSFSTDGTSIADGITRYLSIVGISTPASTEGNIQCIIGRTGTLQNLSIKALDNSLTASSVVNISKNTVGTSLSVTVTTGSTALFQDLVNTVSVTAGDLLTIKVVNGGGSGSIRLSGSFEII